MLGVLAGSPQMAARGQNRSLQTFKRRRVPEPEVAPEYCLQHKHAKRFSFMWRAELASAWHLLARFAWVTAWLIFWQRQRHCDRDKKRDAPAMKCHLGMIHARQKIHYAGQVGMV